MSSKKSQLELIHQSLSQDFEAIDKREEMVAREHPLAGSALP